MYIRVAAIVLNIVSTGYYTIPKFCPP